VGEDALECQLALPRPLPPVADSSRRDRLASPALRIAELAADPVLPLPRARPATADIRVLPLPVGPGGDEGQPVVADLLRTGGLLITGPPGSGRTSALLAFAQHLRAAGTPLLCIGALLTPTAHGHGSPDQSLLLDPGDLAGAARWVAEQAGRPCVVIADDVGAPSEIPALNALSALGGRSGAALLAAGAAGQFAGHYQGPVAHLRRARAGLLLCPGPGDADLLGIRLPRTPLPVRPGSGWLAGGGRLERVQVARRRIPGPDPALR
jgi:S-DNA-T family DNA segregation ATPase FtsK/SpoIIIE